MTIQAFHILPKIREVDEAMTPKLQDRVLEYHPEVAFKAVAGRTMVKPKKRRAGKIERLAVLQAIDPLLAAAVDEEINFGDSGICRVPVDDIIDALVLVIGAWRKLDNQARPLPDPAPVDSRGLRMEIWRPVPQITKISG